VVSTEAGQVHLLMSNKKPPDRVAWRVCVWGEPSGTQLVMLNRFFHEMPFERIK